MLRAHLLLPKLIANEFTLFTLQTLQEKNLPSESHLANEMLNLLLQITKKSGEAISGNLLNLSQVLIEKICSVEDARLAFRKSNIFNEVLLVYPEHFLPQFENLFNEAVGNYFSNVSLDDTRTIQTAQKILEQLTDDQFNLLLNSRFSIEHVGLFTIYEPAYLINVTSHTFNSEKRASWNKTKLEFYGSHQNIQYIEYYKNLNSPQEKIQFVDLYIDFSVKAALFLSMYKKLNDVNEYREDLLQNNFRAAFLESTILSGGETLADITQNKLDELFLALSEHPLRSKLTELEYILKLLNSNTAGLSIVGITMSGTSHFEKSYAEFTKQFTAHHDISYGLSTMNRLSETTTQQWMEQMITKNQITKAGEAISASVKTGDGTQRLHLLMKERLLSSVRNAQNISAKLILKYFKNHLLINHKIIDKQDFAILENNISSDKEKLQLLTYFLSKFEIYGPPEHAKATLQYHLFDKNLFFKLITAVTAKIKIGAAKQIIAIQDDHVTREIDLRTDFEVLLDFLEQSLDYETNLFKAYQAASGTKEKESFNQNLQLRKYQILKGLRPDQNHFLTLGAATQAIPINSKHFNSDGVKKMFKEGINDDDFLRNSLGQYMPEIIDPETGMSYEISKSLTTIQKVKTRNFPLTQLENLLGLRTKRATVSKMLKSRNAESLKENLRILFIKKEFSFFEKIYRSLVSGSSVGLTLIEEFIDERAKSFAAGLMTDYENSQSKKVLKMHLNHLDSLVPNSQKRSLSLTDFFLENHTWLWADLIEEMQFALSSYEEKIVSKETLTYQMGKNAYLALCGGVADVCIANNYDLYKRNSFNLLAVKDQNKYLGFLLLYFIKENEKNILIVGGVEPGVEMLEKFLDLDVYHQMIEVLIEYTQKSNIHQIGLLNVHDISNRKKLNDQLVYQKIKKMPHIKITQPFNRTGSAEENMSYYLLWEKSNN